MHPKYADISTVAWNIFSHILLGIRVEASVSLGRDVIVGRQSNTTAENLRENVIVRKFA
jgi:hypothetical protein